jgi:hypothetical protein
VEANIAMFLGSLLRGFAALIAVVCGMGLIYLGVGMVLYALDPDEHLGTPYIMGDALLFLVGSFLFLFGGGVFLLYVVFDYFRRMRSPD